MRGYWFNIILNWHQCRGNNSLKDNILKVLGGMLLGWRMDATRIAYFRLCLKYLKSRENEMMEQLDTLGEELSIVSTAKVEEPAAASVLSQVDRASKDIADLQDELFKAKRSLENILTANKDQ